VTGLLESGDLRAIGYSGKKVPEAIKDVPTFGEKGYELGICRAAAGAACGPRTFDSLVLNGR
jgi:tripartite-type tricarboxylate transporter receptor subunit TctC